MLAEWTGRGNDLAWRERSRSCSSRWSAIATVVGDLGARHRAAAPTTRSGAAGSPRRRSAPATASDAEIRQLLHARNARRAARGEAPHDVEAELRTLTDPELRDEVRALVRARNARREARGQPPLDVEAEVDRRLSELSAES